MENESEIKAELPRVKRPYVRRAKEIHAVPAPIQQPIAPNPAISAMEGEVVELVKQRSHYRQFIPAATKKLQIAQFELKSVQDEVARLDAEVNERMALISQLRGGTPYMPPASSAPYSTSPQVVSFGYQQEYQPGMPVGSAQAAMSPAYAPATPYPGFPAGFDPRLTDPSDWSSVPAARQPYKYPDVGERISSAEEIRAEEVKNRGF